jgi:uncharacterized protein YbcI
MRRSRESPAAGARDARAEHDLDDLKGDEMSSTSVQPENEGRRDGIPYERGQMLADVSNAIVRIHKQFYGKGPVRARAHMSQDVLTVILEGGFTRGEQTLQDHGHSEEVVRSRLAMQDSVEDEFRVAVETILHRAVRSFMSANDPSNDLQAEIFVLQPRGSETLMEQETVVVALEDVVEGLAERADRAVDRDREALDGA